MLVNLDIKTLCNYPVLLLLRHQISKFWRSGIRVQADLSVASKWLALSSRLADGTTDTRKYHIVCKEVVESESSRINSIDGNHHIETFKGLHAVITYTFITVIRLIFCLLTYLFNNILASYKTITEHIKCYIKNHKQNYATGTRKLLNYELTQQLNGMI
jgi:hypothetical protein